MDKQSLKEIAILLGITIGLVIVLSPKRPPKGYAAPKVAPEDKRGSLKENAQVALEAYTAAYDAKETPSKLAELNRYFIANYGIRVMKAMDDSFVAKTLDGKDILIAK